MARPRKQTADYFPHDAHASEGDTITVLQSRFGNDGYAFWFKLLEKLCSTEGHIVDCNDPIRWKLLCAKAGVDELLAVDIMLLLVEMKAIDPALWESKLIWCQNLVDNLAPVYANRKQELPKKPVSTTDNLVSTPENPITTGDNPPKRESKESKVKKSKEEGEPPRLIFGEFQNVHLSSDEYDKLVKRLGDVSAKDLIERLSGYMKSRRKKYADHYATILNWSRDDATKTLGMRTSGQGGDHGSEKNRGIPGNRPAGAFDDLDES